MKTAVTVLQELMLKGDSMPVYECLSQSGPQHQTLFEYRCTAYDEVVVTTARSKKEAKQEVARLMLQKLASKGHSVPAPYGLGVPVASLYDDGAQVSSPADTRSYVALLRELCEQFGLGAVQYELVGDTGPPHLRHFTMRARLGPRERLATSTTKKGARQLAAEQLYSYLRQNLARLTKDFNEDEALARAHVKAMDRQPEQEERPRRPDLGQKIADYHLGIVSRIDAETKTAAAELLRRELAKGGERQVREQSAERVLAELGALLQLEMERTQLGPLAVLRVAGTPDLAFAGRDAPAAAREALDYLHHSLSWP